MAGRRLEAGQARAGRGGGGLLDAGRLTVVLGGGHETAFASYLGVAGRGGREGPRLGVLNLDAHFDLRDETVPSSGTPFLQMAHAEAAAGRELSTPSSASPSRTTRVPCSTPPTGSACEYLLDEDCTADAVHAFVAAFLDTRPPVPDHRPRRAAGGGCPRRERAGGVRRPAAGDQRVCRQVAASGKLLHVDVAELNPAFDLDNRTARLAARLVNTLLA